MNSDLHYSHHIGSQQLQEGMCLLCNDCCVMQEKSTCLFLSCQNKQPVASVALPGKRLKKVAAVKNMDRKRVFRTQDVRRFRQTAMKSEDLCLSMVLAEQYRFCTTAVDASWLQPSRPNPTWQAPVPSSFQEVSLIGWSQSLRNCFG